MATMPPAAMPLSSTPLDHAGRWSGKMTPNWKPRPTQNEMQTMSPFS